MPRRKYGRKRHTSRRTIKKVVNKILDSKIEKKRISYTWNASTVGTTPAETNLTASIIEGTSSNERVGHSVTLTGLYGKFTVTAADDSNVVRLVIYRPRDPADNLANDALTVKGSIDPDKYFVYSDRLVLVSAITKYLAQTTFKLNMNNLKCRYDTATGEAIQNPVRVFQVSDSAVSSHPTLDGHLYLYYNDI